jgi:hypothetical protein
MMTSQSHWSSLTVVGVVMVSVVLSVSMCSCCHSEQLSYSLDVKGGRTQRMVCASPKGLESDCPDQPQLQCHSLSLPGTPVLVCGLLWQKATKVLAESIHGVGQALDSRWQVGVSDLDWVTHRSRGSRAFRIFALSFFSLFPSTHHKHLFHSSPSEYQLAQSISIPTW